MALEFTHAKSDQVKKSLAVTTPTLEDRPAWPALLWVPIILLTLTALDWFTLFFNDQFNGTYFGNRTPREIREEIAAARAMGETYEFDPTVYLADATYSLLGGILFAAMFATTAAGLFFQRRWAVWVGLLALALEFCFFYFLAARGDWDNFIGMRVPLINNTTDDVLGMPSEIVFLARTVVLGIILLATIPATE